VIFILDEEEILNLIKKKDKENIKIELKNTQKLISNEKIKVKEIQKYIVGFANRLGGFLIFGINDDGTFEGENIFEKFSDGKKSGIDKIKERIEQLSSDKISPQVSITINHFKLERGEILVVEIPQRTGKPHAIIKRSGTGIKSRKYYIRTSHGINTVSDEQLEWMFSNIEVPEITHECKIAINCYRDFGGVLPSRAILQPDGIRELHDFIHGLPEEEWENIKKDNDKKIKFLTEVVPYAILQSLQGQYYPKDENYIFLSNPSNESFIGEIEWDFDQFIKGDIRKIYVPEGTEINIKHNDRKSEIKFRNDNFELYIK